MRRKEQGTTEFDSASVAATDTAWEELIRKNGVEPFRPPLGARRQIIAAFDNGSESVLAGVFYRDNNRDGRFTPGEETSATLLGPPRIEGEPFTAELHWTCYWFEGLTAGRQYRLLYDVDGVERVEAAVSVRPGLNVFHVPIKPTKPLVYVVAHSHFDPEWVKPYEAYMADELPHMVERLEVLREDPSHGFSLDEESASRPLLERYPELRDELRQRIADGMVEPKGLVAAGDLTMPLGESLIRQVTVGERVISDLLGMPVSTDVFWNIDNYGLCFQLPQILAKSGRKYFLMGEYRWFPAEMFAGGGPTDKEWFQKGRWEEGNPHYKEDMPFSNPNVWEHSEFYMQALDGTKVLVHRSPYWAPHVSCVTEVGEVPPYMSAFNFYGGDFAPPDRELTGKLAEYNRTDGEHKCIVSTAPQFFRAVEGEPEIPTFTTESWMGGWTGGYESRIRPRQLSRRLECAILAMERFACMARAAGIATPDRERMESWYLLLINHHHDPQMTPMGPWLIDEVIERYDEIACGLHRLFPLGLPDRIKGDARPGVAFAVFNPFPWPVSRVVEGVGGTHVTDHNGTAMAAQPCGWDDLERKRVSFVARDLPALGWRTYYVDTPDTTAVPRTVVEVNGNMMENEHVRIEFTAGSIKSITNKQSGEALIESTEDAMVNELFVWLDEGCICEIRPLDFPTGAELAGRSSAVSSEFEFTARGPARAVAETRYELDWGVFTQRVVLDAGAVAVRFEVTVDWDPAETGGRRVRVAFPSGKRGLNVLRDVPFAVVDDEQGHTIRPVNAWMGVTDPGRTCGAALIHQGTCSIQTESDIMWMTLFRSVRVKDGGCHSGWDITGDQSLEAGTNEFVYWLYPFHGSWQDAGVARVALEVNTPVPSREVNPSWCNDLPCEKSHLSLEPAVLVLSAFKPAEDGRGYILRAFNPGPDAVEGTVTVGLDAAAAEEANFLERRTGDLTIMNHTIRLTFGPYEVKTIRLS